MKICGYNINFINHTPSDECKKAMIELASRLRFKAPSQSRIKLTLEKQDEHYIGYCKVASTAGVFVSFSKSDNALDCAVQLENFTDEKLSSWNELRHQVLASRFSKPNFSSFISHPTNHESSSSNRAS